MSKTCNACLETKPIDDFYRRARMRDGRSNQCRRCELMRQAEYQRRPESRERRRNNEKQRGKTPEQIRAERLWVWHRLRPEQFTALLESQGGRCAICRSDTPGQWGEFHIDHDHSCCPGKKSCGGCIRGLLCARCNPMLGLSKDSTETLTSAITYLVRPRPVIPPALPRR